MLRKQSKFLEQWKVFPILKYYLCNNVALMLWVGKMGSSQINDEHKYFLMTDTLGDKGTWFYFKIIESGSVGADNETYSTFKKPPKRLIVNVHPCKLMNCYNERIRGKKNTMQSINFSWNISMNPMKICKRY
jgi:hypothetical protein